MEHQCKTNGCGVKFSTLEALQRHADVVHQERLIPCHACDGKLYTYVGLQAHHRSVHLGFKQCPFCLKTLKTLQQVLDHMAREHRLEQGFYVLPGGTPPPIAAVDLRETLEGCVYEIPGMMKMDDGPFFTLYDVNGMHPVYVFEVLDRHNVVIVKHLPDVTFRDDDGLPFRQVTPEAIGMAGYDRGHLAPRRNYMFSASALRSTFKMRNIVPVCAHINTGLMGATECHARRLLKNGWRLKVLTVPVYPSSMSGEMGIGGFELPIPTHFFKIIWLDHEEESLLQIFRFPNRKLKSHYPMFHFKSTIEDLERDTPVRLKEEAVRVLSWETGRTSYRCVRKGCNETFLSQDDRRDHEATHGDARCSLCNRDWPTIREKLECYHSHTKHVCLFCDAKCLSSDALISHMRTHTGEKPYFCEICGKEFAKECTLAAHVRIHTGDKPFKCPYCNYASTDHGNRNKHIRKLHKGLPVPKIKTKIGKTLASKRET